MDEQRKIITAFSEMAPRYEQLMDQELNRFWGMDYAAFLDETLRDFHPSSCDLILDIATGTGFIPGYLVENAKTFGIIIGLDITFDMLVHARKRVREMGADDRVLLVCASAHAMPLKKDSFDRVICCLATHHMDVPALLKNIHQTLKPGGHVTVADAGGSSRWKHLLIKSLIKAGAFLYFLILENFSRAAAESSAIANIHTSEEWIGLFEESHFRQVRLRQLKSLRFYAPDPVIIKAQKHLRKETS